MGYNNQTQHIKTFEWLYIFVMIIYMAQMTPETSRMVAQFSGNPVPFLIPIILTLILLKRNPITFRNNGLYRALTATSVWSVLIAVKYSMTTTDEYSYLFFLFYTIIIAYIHVKVFGNNLFRMYETIMVWLSVISVIMWIPTIVAPQLAHSFYSTCDETIYGNNFLYIFNYMDPTKGQAPRNSGLSWEPGRYAIMVVLAIYCNLLRNGIKLRKNRNLWILLVTMATTMSTTGYSVTLILFLLFYIKNISFSKVLLLVVVILPLVYSIFSLDYMGGKINEQMEDAANAGNIDFYYTNAKNEEGEYAFSLDRFPSMIFEWQNICEDPLLGYSRNPKHSLFYENISSNVRLTGGLLKVIGEFGVFVAFFIYLALFYTSRKLAKWYNSGVSSTLFFTLILCSVSYPVFGVPVFTAFWFFGLYYDDDELDMTTKKAFTTTKKSMPPNNFACMKINKEKKREFYRIIELPINPF